ncbi:MAG: hypothetical protein K2Q20_10295 [Phycisphaerales bacterium]|nr:hypothetical protein [Phycisphaerales bacterium]
MTWLEIAVSVLGVVVLMLALATWAAWCDVWRMLETHERRMNKYLRAHELHAEYQRINDEQFGKLAEVVSTNGRLMGELAGRVFRAGPHAERGGTQSGPQATAESASMGGR